MAGLYWYNYLSESKVSQVEVNFLNNDFTLQGNVSIINNTYVSFDILRTSGNGNIKGLKLFLEDAFENTRETSLNLSLGIGESANINFTYSNAEYLKYITISTIN